MVKKLKNYAQRRDFTKTPEPMPKVKKSEGRTSKRGARRSKNIFVIQKHHASHLHYDLRIEINGVLKSWAVPKGPSTNPTQKRLATLTEDHPLEYASFEGIIPEGYGAGTVIVWDTGTFKNLTEENNKKISLKKAFEDGHIKMYLNGKKLKGIYAITRFKENNWLLVKVHDEYADFENDLTISKPKSVLSNKTTEKLDKQFERRAPQKKIAKKQLN